jgi:hypothetical protein
MSDTAIQAGGVFRTIGAGLRTPLAQSVIAGIVVGALSILFYLCYAALIFSGPLTPWLSYGIAASCITGAIGGAMVSLFSSLRFQVAGPDGSTCAISAALVASVAGHVVGKGADTGLLAATLVTLALSSAVTGLFLGSLGLARAGRAIRFVPYPVIGGFFVRVRSADAAGRRQGFDRREPELGHARKFHERRQHGKSVGRACGNDVPAGRPASVEIDAGAAGAVGGQRFHFLHFTPSARRSARRRAGARLDVSGAVGN